MNRVRLSSRLHKPAMLLFFEMQEWGIIFLCYLVSMLAGGWFWLNFLITPAVVIPLMRRQPRGYFSHMTNLAGMKDFDFYPPLMLRDFNE